MLSATLVAGGTWAFRFRSRGTMKFYVVAEGSCWLRIEGQLPPLRLDQGDVLLFWGPKTFVVGGTPTAPARDVCPVFDRGGSFARIGSRAECVVLTGVVSLHPSSAALFTSGLPTLVHVLAADRTLRGPCPRAGHGNGETARAASRASSSARSWAASAGCCDSTLSCSSGSLRVS